MEQKERITKPVKAKQPTKKVVAEKEKIKKVAKAKPVVKEVEIEMPKDKTLFDKYRKHIETAQDGYLRDITYAEAIEIKDFIHKKTGHNIGITMSCGACLVSLVQTFANLEK